MESEDREQERKIAAHEEEPEEDVEGHKRFRSDEPDEDDSASEEDVEGHHKRFRSDEPDADDEASEEDTEG
jgi:hypothetical protein